MRRNSLARVAATASALVAFTLVGALGTAQAATKVPDPPTLSKAQARALHAGKRPSIPQQHERGGANAKAKAKASQVTTIVCAECGAPSITTWFCLGGVDGCNNTVPTGDGYVSSTSVANWTFPRVITNDLFPDPIGIDFFGYQPRIQTRNGQNSQLVAVAWGWESKYNNTAASGNSGWYRWYWAYASRNGILIPFQSGNCFCYGRDSVTHAGVSELSNAFTINRRGNAWRMKIAVAWYGANGQISTAPKVYNVPLYKNINTYWYWGVDGVFDGTVAP